MCQQLCFLEPAGEGAGVLGPARSCSLSHPAGRQAGWKEGAFRSRAGSGGLGGTFAAEWARSHFRVSGKILHGLVSRWLCAKSRVLVHVAGRGMNEMNPLFLSWRRSSIRKYLAGGCHLRTWRSGVCCQACHLPLSTSMAAPSPTTHTGLPNGRPSLPWPVSYFSFLFFKVLFI